MTIGALALALSAGCSEKIEDYCDRLGEECGADPEDVVSCKDFGESYEIAARNAECEPEFDAWVKCLNGARDVCDPAALSASCDEKLAAVEQCGVDVQ